MITPQHSAPYVLAQYRERPEAERPTLEFRFVSRFDRMRIERCFKQAMDQEGEAFFESIKEGVMIALCGWEKFPISYDRSRLDEILTDVDYAELRRDLLEHVRASQLFYVACVSGRPSTQASVASDSQEAATA